jgi:hypothetical protein
MTQWSRGLAALGVAGVLAGGVALARGPDMNLPIFGSTPGMPGPSYSHAPSFTPYRNFVSPSYEAPAEHARSYEEAPEHRKAKRTTSASAASFGYGKPVCVRLCDGSFFPTSSVSGGEAACAAQCPDAPTALYTMPTDRIEDAVSSTGKPYTALPVAKRFETSFESTCTCHRDGVYSPARELLKDPTLRKGDVVMTADGFRVYEGDGYRPSGEKDFVALARAHVPNQERAELTAMERARAGSPAPSRPSLVATRRPKGKVTVDNGTDTAER